MSARKILILLLALAPAACTRPPAPVPVVVAPVEILDAEALCLKDLAALNVAFQPVETFGDPDQGCGIANPVKVSASGVPWSRPGVLTCAMARTIARFEAEVVQPAAEARFGQKIKKLHHAGTYDCRVRRSGQTGKATPTAAAMGGSRGGRLSEHAKGQAIDLTAFELADGTVVSVKKDWRGAGAKSSFLQDVSRASCRSFNVVLTPNHDRLHQDHVHLDIGPHTLCGF